jgi:LmbE family N-acetylglucosaminyl deacetylase
LGIKVVSIAAQFYLISLVKKCQFSLTINASCISFALIYIFNQMTLTIYKRKISSYWLFAILMLINFNAFSNQPSSEIYVDVQKLSSLKKVLYIAAHPDDENTRALAWFSLSEHAETAYLSLTRGDGGQNLIGEELSEDLGVLRTQELLAARSFDRAQQYFSKAVDFGYSKSAEETFDKWGKEAILADVVLMIRKFQPDVIITRFPPDERGGHGHHSASAILAIEAFDKAADSTFLPEQVEKYGVWKTTSIYWNASNWWNKDLDKLAANNPKYIIKDIGGYNELLGMSYNEIGTLARSQHKCQGFGAIVERGSRTEFFEHLGGELLKSDFFEQSTKTWTTIINADFEKQLNQLLADFDFLQPENNVDALLTLKKQLELLPNSDFKTNKLKLCNQIIFDCLGLYADIVSPDYAIAAEAFAEVTVQIINRSDVEVALTKVNQEPTQYKLAKNAMTTHKMVIWNKQPIAHPYWLNQPFTNVFTVENEADVLKAANDAPFEFPIELLIKGSVVQVSLPVEYVWQDPSYGERRRATVSTPKFTVNFNPKLMMLTPGQTKSIELKVHSFVEDLEDTIQIQVPEFWEISQTKIPIQLAKKHDELFITIQITAKANSKKGQLVLKNNKDQLLKSFTEITYDHIPTQVLFKSAIMESIKIDAKINPGKIAYIKGVEDGIPQAIEQLGFPLQTFEVKDLSSIDLKQFQTVILGIRIYNVLPELKNFDSQLFDYVEQGGNLVMQYITASRSELDNKFGGPIPFEISRNRVTEEDAAVTFLHPEHSLMNFPNKITAKDFDFWVQERGLYFANNWAENYQPLFAWNDEGEEPQNGALIVAKHGKGQFIYTGISFFRLLPNGVEGAYRLFANLLSYERK